MVLSVFYCVWILCTFSKQNNEQRLLQQAKSFTNQLTEQKLDLEKADMFPENSNTEVTEMREKLLNHHNDLAAAEERLYLLNYKIEW